MGLIKAITGAAGGVLADSWKDFYYCDADVLNENVLAAKGMKRTSDKGRSSNVHGESNIISDGSVIAVNDGQCMIIVESGEVVEICAEPGQFTYDRSTEPSLFTGDLGEAVKASLGRVVERFTFGGDSASTSSTRRKSTATSTARLRRFRSVSSTPTWVSTWTRPCA